MFPVLVVTMACQQFIYDCLAFWQLTTTHNSHQAPSSASGARDESELPSNSGREREE